MNSSLRPEQRVNKLGHVVVKHVKNDDAGNASKAARIPAPSLSFVKDESELLDRSQWIELISKTVSGAGRTFAPGFVPRMTNFLYAYDYRELEFIHSVAERMDGNGVGGLFGGIPERPSSTMDIDHHLFLTAAHAFSYCKEVNEADPSDSASWGDRGGLLAFARRTFGGEHNMKFRFDKDAVADLEGAYLLNRIGLDKESFNSIGSYYRGLGKLKGMQEEIKPYLPLLIAMHTAYEDSNRDYFFNDEYYFWSNIEDIMKFPEEKIGIIARETQKRGEYDPEIAQALIESDAGILSEGVI